MKFNLRLPSLKKLRATTTARQLIPSRDMDEVEPTMKLSTAFVVVLLLHLIAVGGILAFNTIKAHRPDKVRDVEFPAPPVTPAAQAPAIPEDEALAAKAAATPAPEIAPSTAPKAVAAKSPDTVKPAAAPKKAGALRDSGTIYTVVKGDIPERIARKYGVAYNDLIKLNHIEDATRIRIGQKLHIPVKVKATAAN